MDTTPRSTPAAPTRGERDGEGQGERADGRGGAWGPRRGAREGGRGRVALGARDVRPAGRHARVTPRARIRRGSASTLAEK